MAHLAHALWNAPFLRLSGTDRLEAAGLAMTVMRSQLTTSLGRRTNGRAFSKLRAPEKGSRCDKALLLARLAFGANRLVDGHLSSNSLPAFT